MLSASLRLLWLNQNFSLFEKHCIDTISIALTKKHHDSFLNYIHYKTCESNLANVALAVLFGPF